MSAERVQAAAYRPPSGEPPRRQSWLRPLPVVVCVLLLLFLGAAWFLLTARAVTLEFTPTPDSLAIEGGLSLPMGDRVLLRPGRYTVVATKPGYHRLEQTIQVTGGGKAPSGQTIFKFQLKKLPGRLRVHSQPSGAQVSIDGEAVGQTPIQSVKVEPGTHKLRISARRHQVYTTRIDIAGKNKLQTIKVELTPAWAPVTVTSEPAGAILRVDGDKRGTTPITIELGAGHHELTLRLESYESWQRRIEVEANKPRELETVQLARARGELMVASKPSGASVSVAGEFRGSTPVTMAVAPATALDVRVSKPGYRAASRDVRVASGERERLAITLDPVIGTVTIRVQPSDATVYVDGDARGTGSQTLELTATGHRIAVREAGYAPFETTVTPKPGFDQVITVNLKTEAEARMAAIPDTIISPTGGRLVLMPTGQFTMGTPRRAQGSRSNEVRRKVKLTRAFYIGVHEVTNAQFRKFRASHSSGIVGRETLSNPRQPVVRVSWADAVAYCNWLSRQAGLPVAYNNGELITPVTTGYRLPTEAEWAWAARFAGGRDLQYAWGESMPPQGSAGNYADTAAAGLVSQYLQVYTDGFPASAPVMQFGPSAVGLYDMGGNVVEWMNDWYSAAPRPPGVEVSPIGPPTGKAHVVRGASWRHWRLVRLRLAWRGAATSGQPDLGFRVARYAE